MGARSAAATAASAPRAASRPRLHMLVKSLSFRSATPSAAAVDARSDSRLPTITASSSVDLPNARDPLRLRHLIHHQSDGSIKPLESDACSIDAPPQSPVEFTVLPIAPKAFVRRRKSVATTSTSSSSAPTGLAPSSSSSSLPKGTSSRAPGFTLSRRASSPAAGAPNLTHTSRSLSERKSVNSIESDDSSGSGGGGIYGWNPEEAEEANRAYVEFMRKKTGRVL
ncbi:hypothetical protein HDU83_000106 [Entophlyctis luteolus]|nr:hypothetical protein HDU82_004537 [Entophlyctis luteolus]KAJ3358049.1 hypothetical protein HDU83_000106 [Entophlyctis luteolus]